MGRKDLSAKRIQQILDAFEACILKHGLDGSTLEVIAEEAKMKRSIIRHYIGNREDVLGMLIQRVLERERKSFPTTEVWQSMSQEEIVSVLLAELFDPPVDDQAYVNEMLKGLWMSCTTDNKTRTQLKSLYLEYRTGLELALAFAYPSAPRKAIVRCSLALLCLSDGYSSFCLIDLCPRSELVKSTKASARELISQMNLNQ
ncbi:MAG: AcrR family transcriptional regulator [Verrucomicrobiales bacterium]|jgi:AcrR family transcriptional regulator